MTVDRTMRGALLVLVCGSLTTLGVGCVAPVGSEDNGQSSEAMVSSDAIVKGGTTDVPRTPTESCGTSIPWSYVLRLKDTDGSHYGINDGYTIPFPTPWATGYPQKYEELLEQLPTHLTHEYLVKNVILSGRQIKEIDDHQFFVVGFEGTTDYAAAVARANAYAANPVVQSQILKCVEVLDGLPTPGAVTTPTGESYSFAGEQDPSRPPW